jgi:site-specific recombinase XerD
LNDLESQLAEGACFKPVAEAVDAFLASRSAEPSTGRKYRRILRYLGKFLAVRERDTIDRVRLEDLDEYRRTRELCALSWSKELQLLRTFFAFCLKRKWCRENPARDMEMPPDPKPRPREPCTSEEITRILSACETFGRSPMSACGRGRWSCYCVTTACAYPISQR